MESSSIETRIRLTSEIYQNYWTIQTQTSTAKIYRVATFQTTWDSPTFPVGYYELQYEISVFVSVVAGLYDDTDTDLILPSADIKCLQTCAKQKKTERQI